MEDDENDLDNIFEEHGVDDEPQGEEESNNNEGDAENDTQTAERVPVPKRVVKNPRLKFNAERLCGNRGIPVIINHFKDVKFKGKGREVEDLNRVMFTLEHWCHRLFPSMKFDDCLRQIEKLGKKRPVQTCVRKIRMDMPILDSDFVRRDEDENRDEVRDELDVEVPEPDAFDRLVSESHGTSNTPLVSTPLPVKTTAAQVLGTSFGNTLTDEQRKRMEYNKLLATERRKAKMAAMQSTSTDDVDPRQELFSATSSSVEKVANVQDKNSLWADSSYAASASLLDFRTDETLPAPVTNSDELGLDDLVDLVDEEPESVVDNARPSTQLDAIDLTNEVDKNSSFAKGCVEYIDLANEKQSSKGNQVEVIDLNDKDDDKSIENASNHVEMIDLESEKVDKFHSKGSQDDLIQIESNKQLPETEIDITERENLEFDNPDQSGSIDSNNQYGFDALVMDTEDVQKSSENEKSGIENIVEEMDVAID